MIDTGLTQVVSSCHHVLNIALRLAFWLRSNLMFLIQLSYENWAYGEPNNYQNVEYCGELKGEPGMSWNDINCEHLNNWICQIKKGMINCSPLSLRLENSCPGTPVFSLY